MRDPEGRLWDAIRAHKPRDVFLARIENMLDDGMPDVIAAADAGATFCELKARPQPPARRATPVMGAGFGLRTSQRNFLLWWTRHGQRALIVARVGTALWVHDGRWADEYNAAAADAFEGEALGRGMDDLYRLLRSTDWRKR